MSISSKSTGKMGVQIFEASMCCGSTVIHRSAILIVMTAFDKLVEWFEM